MALTSISNRLTPSTPIEITFGAQPIAAGSKITTIFGHRAASGGTGVDYGAYSIVNVGDPVAALAEVDALAGSGSQLGKMAKAFVDANAAVGRSNFPKFRVVILKNSDTGFGAADEALEAVKHVRSDMFVSPYPLSNATAEGKLVALCALLSGPDRDLQGQFGSFATIGCIDASASALAFVYNSKFLVEAYLQDTNTALVSEAGVLTISSDMITAMADTTGINIGAQISGIGVADGAVVVAVFKTSVQMSLAASATEASAAIAFQNVVSQSADIVAAAHAGAMMASAFPYFPLQGVQIGGLVAPQKNSDKIQIDPNGLSEACLVAGLSPLNVQAGGTVAFIRARTSWTMDGLIPKVAYFDWQDLVTLNDFREACFLIAQNPPFNNNPGGTKASAQVAALFKDEVLREALAFEDAGAFQAVKSLAPQFLVQPSSTSRGRLDFKVPVNVLPGLYVIAGNIEATTSFDFTL